MFIYNVHAPNKTFALKAKETEDADTLLSRILAKARLDEADEKAVRSGRDGAGVVYEFDGDRWALEDDDDLAIVTERFKTEDRQGKAMPSVTLHVVQPNSRSNGNGYLAPPPPAYASASQQYANRSQKKKGSSRLNGNGASAAGRAPSDAGSRTPSRAGSRASAAPSSHSTIVIKSGTDPLTASTSLCIPNRDKNRARSVRSMRSTTSRKSKWGDDNAEPLGDVKRRQFEDFHANNGVRTVVGAVGDVQGVRMLLKQGYKGVYVSRSFAVRHGLISPKERPGFGGYGGLVMLGNVPITVGEKTALHPVMLSEEQHFDVVLGRSWVEKMNIKVDPLDPTALTYMDTGETIACDLVVLRDSKGNIIHVS